MKSKKNINMQILNSFQQHVVHIHDKVVKGRDKDVSATVIGQNGQNVLKETDNDLLFKNSENCCYACIKEREDSSNIKHKKFSSKQSKGVINFTTKKGPPPLYNSKTLCFSDNSRSFGNDIHVSRFKSSKLHQNRRKLQTKINQPLKNISCNQNENYTSSEVCKPVGGNSSVLEEHYQQEMYRGTVSQDMIEESEPTNQMVDNKISRAVCIENDEISQRDKVVVKLELMDSENEEDFQRSNKWG
ncbi:hypothetical protein KUTeg_024560 [Tegillarca granosa]|uniref:Uncharacterized protein n=1 Tax=Tegillarca granosa TaxID=220873 RepID=A0ABQ9DY84_TEGGR|nr:hypothetical protein KUTeg_024560 [Tegillarca granosa]